jgi:uncharacterized membrane protein
VGEASGTEPVPRWLVTACLVLSILGLAVSAYLTYEHFALSGGQQLSCPIGGKSCTAVTTSPQSKLLGVPVALLGLLYYVAMVVLNLPALWRASIPAVKWVRLAAGAAGMVFVLWLVYAELYLIHAICMWCSIVHILTFVLFCLILWGTFGVVAEEEDVCDDEDD